MRQNVLKHLASISHAEDAIVLTHDIDFLFVQSTILPSLKKAGNPKLTILADAGRAAVFFASQKPFLSLLGQRFRVVPISMPGRFRFHPKAIMLSGKERAVLAVGSGNCTFGGWSSNAESWLSWDTKDDGSGAFAAFKEYLESIIAQHPMNEGTIEDINSAFDPAPHKWAIDMMVPESLRWNDGENGILDHIAATIPPNPEKVTIVSPFFDKSGRGVKAIAERFNAEVTVYLQKNREGLQSNAAETFPANVTLKSIVADGGGFIHAKTYLFYYPDSMWVALGSANCSVGGLGLDGGSGNEELIAIRKLSHAEGVSFMESIEVLPELPVLPHEVEENDEDDEIDPGLHLFSVSLRPGFCEAIYSPQEATNPQLIVSDKDGEFTLLPSGTNGQATVFNCDGKPITAYVRAQIDGETVDSSPIWIDHEDKLSVRAPFRRMLDKILSGGSQASWTGAELLSLLDHFEVHIEHEAEAAAKGLNQARRSSGDSTEAKTYSLDDVFSPNFAKPVTGGIGQFMGSSGNSDFSDFLLDLLGMKSQEPAPENDNGDDDDDDGDGDGDDKIKRTAKKTPQFSEDKRKNPEDAEKEKESHRRKANKLISKMIERFAADDWWQNVSGEFLARDVAFFGVMLWKLRVHEILPVEDYLSSTNEAWEILFGSVGKDGVLLRRLTNDPDISSEFSQPKIAAAIGLWLVGEDASSPTGVWLYFTASEMLARGKLNPFLLGGNDQEISAYLYELVEKAGDGKQSPEVAIQTWRTILQQGYGLGAILTGLDSKTPVQLASTIRANKLNAGTILWQGNSLPLFILPNDCSRASNQKTDVIAFTDQKLRKFQSSMLIPLTELIEQSPELVDEISTEVSEHVGRMMREFEPGLRSRFL